MIESFLAYLWAMKMRNLATGYEIQIRSRDVVFHEQETMSDSVILAKTGEPSGKVDFAPISPPK